jgi:hypothetical protein
VAGQYQPGATVPATLFSRRPEGRRAGHLDRQGLHAGTIKRHNFSSQRASHGNSRSHNVPGSISMAQDPGRVFPGKKMSGHMGDETVTTQNLDIVRVDEARSAAARARRRAGLEERPRGRAPGRQGQGQEGSPVMQLELLNEQGQATAKVDAPDTVFARDYNEALVHQVVVAYQANARQGTRAQLTAPRSSTRPRSRSVRRAPAAHAPA